MALKEKASHKDGAKKQDKMQREENDAQQIPPK